MDDFTFYFRNGWNHIVSIQALDHLLFLAALTASYSIRRWRHMAILITAFTIGHSITLAISTYDLMRFNTDWVEFLIPLSILLTCIYNLLNVKQTRSLIFQYAMALFFGLIHGMGFANTLRFMLAREQSIVLPLLGFNIGIEVAQIAVVIIIMFVQFIVVERMKLIQKWWTYILSGAAAVIALYMCISRWPL